MLALNSIILCLVVSSRHEFERVNEEVCSIFCGRLAVSSDNNHLHFRSHLLFIVQGTFRTFRSKLHLHETHLLFTFGTFACFLIFSA